MKKTCEVAKQDRDEAEEIEPQPDEVQVMLDKVRNVRNVWIEAAADMELFFSELARTADKVTEELRDAVWIQLSASIKKQKRQNAHWRRKAGRPRTGKRRRRGR